MSEHLKKLVEDSRKYLATSRDAIVQLETSQREAWRSMELALAHLESVPPASPETLTEGSKAGFAPTTGPVVKRYGSAFASLDTSQGQCRLTVETGDCSKSILFTSEEWAAIRQHFSTSEPTSELPTLSGPNEAGSRGVASPEVVK